MSIWCSTCSTLPITLFITIFYTITTVWICCTSTSRGTFSCMSIWCSTCGTLPITLLCWLIYFTVTTFWFFILFNLSTGFFSTIWIKTIFTTTIAITSRTTICHIQTKATIINYLWRRPVRTFFYWTAVIGFFWVITSPCLTLRRSYSLLLISSP